MNEVEIIAPKRARAGTRSCARVWIVKGETALAVRGFSGHFQVRGTEEVIRFGRRMGLKATEETLAQFDSLQAALDWASARVRKPKQEAAEQSELVALIPLTAVSDEWLASRIASVAKEIGAEPAEFSVEAGCSSWRIVATANAARKLRESGSEVA